MQLTLMVLINPIKQYRKNECKLYFTSVIKTKNYQFEFAHKMSRTQHFFIEIKETRQGIAIKRGTIESVNVLVHKKNYSTQSDEAFDEVLHDAFKTSGKKDALIFIHGLWAYSRPMAYHLLQFDKHVVQKTDSNIAFTLNIIWHTPMPSYFISRRQCKRLALGIAPVFWNSMDNLLKINGLHPRLHLLCHSMGNYFFENLLQSKPLNKKVFEQVLLVAADVDIDFFEKYTDDMKALTNRVVLINNKNDVLLKVSRYLNRVRRLGIAPPQYFEDFQPFLKATEISQVGDVRNVIALSGQHIYYNASVKVLNYIKSLLEGGAVLEKIE
jgi:esterase/lipase superfamily enzyme